MSAMGEGGGEVRNYFEDFCQLEIFFEGNKIEGFVSSCLPFIYKFKRPVSLFFKICGK